MNAKKEEKNQENHQKKEADQSKEAIGALEKQLLSQKAIAEDLKDTAKRVQADFENFAKRVEKEKEEFKKFANAKVVLDFLPVLDSLNDGISAMQKQQSVSKDAALDGLVLLKKQFFSVLEKHGLKEIEALGKKFDPHFHECLLKEHDKTKEDEIILEEFQKGYLLNGKVLRTSKAKINKLTNEQ